MIKSTYDLIMANSPFLQQAIDEKIGNEINALHDLVTNETTDKVTQELELAKVETDAKHTELLTLLENKQQQIEELKNKLQVLEQNHETSLLAITELYEMVLAIGGRSS